MQQEQNNKSSRKYLLSLLYTLKDLLFFNLKKWNYRSVNSEHIDVCCFLKKSLLML